MRGDVSTEERLYRDRDWIANSPGLANGGIALAVVEPETVGWAKVASLVDDYGFIAFAAADKQTIFDQIRDLLGNEGDLLYWDSFTAAESDVLPICEAIVASAGNAFSLASECVPDTDIIEEVVELNRDVGVSPLPGWYMQGEGPPSLTSWIRSADGRMVACANGSMRYHADSRMAQTYYVGSVSVASSARGHGLGNLATALLIRDGIRIFGPNVVTGVAQPANMPSRAMLMRCGLVHDTGRATVIYNRSGAFHTR